MNKSVMQHNFASLEGSNIPRSTFNRNHGWKGTFNAGYLIPILVDEIYPGETLTCRMHGLARLNTPIHPIMDNIFMDTFFFFVPNRLTWTNWQKFMGEQEDPGDSTDFTVPEGSRSVTSASLLDYMGIPLGTHTVNDLPIRAYQLIFNEWFRDQNLQDSKSFEKGDAVTIGIADYGPHKRAKQKDYFTSCLPWPEKDNKAALLPLGEQAPVFLDKTQTGPWNVHLASNYNTTHASSGTFSSDAQADLQAGSTEVVIDPVGKMYADLNLATAATINQMRLAVTVQRMFEMDARGGTRYTELNRQHFGVVSPDARLQRPELLGMGSTPINIIPVPQTSSTDAAVSPQGNLSAYGTANVKSNGFTKSFTEHGVIIGLVNVKCDLTYSQGIDKMWSRQTRHDYYFPSFANLGEQAVLNKEIFAQNLSFDEDVFGYQERWAELRFKNSKVTGLFRPDAAGTLASWVLTEDFASLPVLDDTFIQSSSETVINRAIAVPSEPQFKLDCFFEYTHVRPMPQHSTPGLMRF